MFSFTPIHHYSLRQGSEAWFQHRMGKISASESKKLFVPSKVNPEEDMLWSKDDLRRKWGRGAITYMQKLAQEFITRDRVSVTARPLAWGHQYEAEARILYEEITGYKVREVGFVDMFPGCGCSPDGEVEEDGVIEIKCPFKQEIFNSYALEIDQYRVPKPHRHQVFHNIVGCKRKWCDYVIYDPRLVGYDRIKIVRSTLDASYMKEIATPEEFVNKLLSFRHDLAVKINELKKTQQDLKEKEQKINYSEF